jgi:hypothetical protein
MRTRRFAWGGLALGVAFVTMPLIAAEQPAEGLIDGPVQVPRQTGK